MKHCQRNTLLAISLITVSACAHPAKGSTDVSAADVQSGDIVIPPKMLMSKTQLTLHSRGGRPRGTIEVPVDPSGAPDVFGIRYLGSFDDLTRRDLAEYIGQSMFSPAKRNGVAVAGVFKMEFR